LKSRLFTAALVLMAALHGAGATETAPALRIDFAGHQKTASADARYAAGWVARHTDNEGWPFIIVDKKKARLFVFEADGWLHATSAVLLGAGPGDASVPGIASREPGSLLAWEQTTPAGRFVSEPGTNLKGEDVVWVDYDAKIAIHRLRPGAAQEQRAGRLASSASDDKRVTLGCIVVPVSFYESAIKPVFGQRRGVVYVLPETGTVQAMFAALNAS
jgi:hypothetical protein